MNRQIFLRNVFLLGSLVLLTACAHSPMPGHVSPPPAPKSAYQISFRLPAQPRWHSAGLEQDARGYSQSWLPLVKGGAAAQSLYVNFGRGIATSLSVSRRQVIDAMQAGCRKVESQVSEQKKNRMVFTLGAAACETGRPVWQVFHVFNAADGQYAIVYSANPAFVSRRSRLRMQQVVAGAHLVSSRHR